MDKALQYQSIELNWHSLKEKRTCMKKYDMLPGLLVLIA
jgi:hypothetical protein